MKKHTKIYLEHHDYSPVDIILCQVCESVAVDIHHIETKGIGGDPSKDIVGNLIALCRCCHEKAHAGKISKEQLKQILGV